MTCPRRSLVHNERLQAAVFGDVGECLVQGRLCRGAGPLVGKPAVDAGIEGGGAILADGQPGGGVAAADLSLDGV